MTNVDEMLDDVEDLLERCWAGSVKAEHSKTELLRKQRLEKWKRISSFSPKKEDGKEEEVLEEGEFVYPDMFDTSLPQHGGVSSYEMLQSEEEMGRWEKEESGRDEENEGSEGDEASEVEFMRRERQRRENHSCRKKGRRRGRRREKEESSGDEDNKGRGGEEESEVELERKERRKRENGSRRKKEPRRERREKEESSEDEENKDRGEEESEVELERRERRRHENGSHRKKERRRERRRREKESSEDEENKVRGEEQSEVELKRKERRRREIGSRRKKERKRVGREREENSEDEENKGRGGEEESEVELEGGERRRREDSTHKKKELRRERRKEESSAKCEERNLYSKDSSYLKTSLPSRSKVRTYDCGFAVGSKIQLNVEKEDEPEEGEFIEDDYVDNLILTDDDDVRGIGSIDQLNVMEEASFAVPANCEQVGATLSDTGVNGGFVCELNVGSKLEQNIEKEDEPEEGEFVEDDYVVNLILTDDDDVRGIGSIDQLNVMEEADIAGPANYKQVGATRSAIGVGGSFVCELNVYAEGMRRVSEFAKQIIEGEAAITEVKLVKEIVEEEGAIAEVKSVKEILVSEDELEEGEFVKDKYVDNAVLADDDDDDDDDGVGSFNQLNVMEGAGFSVPDNSKQVGATLSENGVNGSFVSKLNVCAEGMKSKSKSAKQIVYGEAAFEEVEFVLKVVEEEGAIAEVKSFEETIVSEDEPEEGEFVEDDYVDNVIPKEADDDVGEVEVGSVNQLNVMEDAEFAAPDNCEQVGVTLSENGVDGRFVSQLNLCAEGMKRESESPKQIVEGEATITEVEFVKETIEEEGAIAAAKSVEDISTSEEPKSAQDRAHCASRFDAKLGEDGVIQLPFVDVKTMEEDALADADLVKQPKLCEVGIIKDSFLDLKVEEGNALVDASFVQQVGSSFLSEALEVGEVLVQESTKSLVFNQMPAAEIVERSIYKNYPRRSISAKRTFPLGCGNKKTVDIPQRHNKSVEASEDGRWGVHKSSDKSWSEEFVKAKNEERKEIRVEDTFRGDFKRSNLPRTRDVEHVNVREDFLSRRGLGPSDNRIRSSWEKLDMRSMDIRNSINIKRKLPGNSEDGSHVISQSQTQKYDVLEPSIRRVNIQALMAASNCPWSKGRQATTAPVGLIKPKNISTKDKSVVQRWNSLNSICNEVEDYVSGEEEEYDRPLVKRPRNMDSSSTRHGLGRLDTNGGNIQVDVNRNKVKNALRMFQTLFRVLLRDEEGKSKGVPGLRRVDLKTASILKDNNKWVNTGGHILGEVPGVEVGDEFHYRVELAIVGLHRPYQGGIDTTNSGGQTLATSIVASGGYDDVMDSSDVLRYTGQGGNPTRGAKVATDQKLVRGNLALKNSRDAQTPVRVIRGIKESKGNESLDARLNTAATLVYDGLYKVEKYWMQKGSYGNNVFMFQLRRMEGQPELPMKELKITKNARSGEGLRVRDISHGKENIPIPAVNTIDDEKPPQFEYLTKMRHRQHYNPIPPSGCGCNDGCSNSSKCSCAIKNGGIIPFTYNGALVEFKPLVYECGPKCKCPPSCYNKVSQQGIKFPLEVFKTEYRGWGVRSLMSIPSGSFICEYTGKLLQEEDAEQRAGSDEYLFDIGRSFNDHALWEGLSKLIPDHLKSSSLCEDVEDVGFTIDAAECGNVGRFINHSCSPNLYVQNVLYDHDDKRMPHIMLFAVENIPPLKELTYNYNYTLNQVRDAEGNIKKKKCYCGSRECTGRLY